MLLRMRLGVFLNSCAAYTTGAQADGAAKSEVGHASTTSTTASKGDALKAVKSETENNLETDPSAGKKGAESSLPAAG
jgi:hypothetical protein